MTDISNSKPANAPEPALAAKVTPVPQLIDDEFATKLAKRGQSEFSAFNKKHQVVVIVLCFLVALSLLPAFHAFLQLPLALTALCMLLFPLLKTRKVLRAFKAHRYDVVAELLPNAHRLNIMWFPLTAFQFRKTLIVQMRLLTLEGRFAELEAIVHYYWGATETKRSEFVGIPNNHFVANALAIACSQQNKFEQAEQIFSDLLSCTTDKSERVLLLTNLANCLVRKEHLDEAEKILLQAKNTIPDDIQSAASLRLYMLEAFILAQKNELVKAEELITMSSALAKKLHEVRDIEAFCEDVMGQIRTRQHSYEEAKLYHQNAIDIMQSSDNPHYLVLVEYTNRLADMLAQSGQVEQAKVQYARAKQIFDMYVDREKYALDLMRNRLDNPINTAFGGDLIALAERIKYLDTIGP